jgi:phosphatidylcholine synthase
VTGLYIYFIGAIMQFFPNLGRTAAVIAAEQAAEAKKRG